MILLELLSSLWCLFSHLGQLSCQQSIGSEIDIHLTFPYCLFFESIHCIVWNLRIEKYNFGTTLNTIILLLLSCFLLKQFWLYEYPSSVFNNRIKYFVVQFRLQYTKIWQTRILLQQCTLSFSCFLLHVLSLVLVILQKENELISTSFYILFACFCHFLLYSRPSFSFIYL